MRRRGKTTSSRRDPLVDALGAAVGPDAVLTDGLRAGLYRRDASLIEGHGPVVVCLPATPAAVQDCVRTAAAHDRAVVARGAGTGLTGGAVPESAAVVVATTRLDAVREVDAVLRRAWVEPGVVNLDLTRHLHGQDLHFAPDPSSQQSCTVGGNIANNSGGPHCLAYGVTTAHVLAVELVLGDGTLVRLGGPEPEAPTYDLRGVVVGSEGTLGIVTGALVRLTPDPPAVATVLGGFSDVRAAAAAVGAVIAAGIVPAALEMLEGALIAAVDRFCGAGFPPDAGAVLLAELDGAPAQVAEDAAHLEAILAAHGATSAERAADPGQRARWWKARKAAFGAVAQIAPDYYLHDTVVPRQALPEVLDAVGAIAARHGLVVMNVFHAGDGNLHPLLVFDAREPGALDRVHAAGAEIVAASLAVGGVLSGEHGIGLEKRPFMAWYFSDADLDAQARVVEAFDPSGVCNPGKVLPVGRGCGEVTAPTADLAVPPPSPPRPDADAVLAAFASAVGAAGPVTVVGGGSHRPLLGLASSGREVRAPVGIVSHQPDELILRVRAGTPVREVEAALAGAGQRCTLEAIDATTTVGGALAVGWSGLDRLRHGPLRDAVLEATWVSAAGELVRAGGPTVKNVTGFDLVRLHVGALGTLGFLAEVVLRLVPVPRLRRWVEVQAAPETVLAALYRPAAVLWDGRSCRVLVEGHPDDVARDTTALGRLGAVEEVAGPFALPAHRWSIDPAHLTSDTDLTPFGDGAVVEVGVGTVHAARAQPSRSVAPGVVSLHDRVRAAFDPTGRLNPGVDALALRGGRR